MQTVLAQNRSSVMLLFANLLQRQCASHFQAAGVNLQSPDLAPELPVQPRALQGLVEVSDYQIAAVLAYQTTVVAGLAVKLRRGAFVTEVPAKMQLNGHLNPDRTRRRSTTRPCRAP